MTTTNKPGLFDKLRKLASEINGQPIKRAAERGATEETSTHPSADGENNTRPATEGARSAENVSDIKEQEGPAGVDATAAAVPGTQQDKVMPNIGMTQSATGEAPEVEDKYKGEKDDPGTSHPATAEMGEKYAKLTFQQKIAQFNRLANEALAEVAVGMVQKRAEDEDDDDDDDKEENKGELVGGQHKLDVNNNGKIDGSDLSALRAGKEAAYAAGYEAAARAGVSQKQAAAHVQSVLQGTMADAMQTAELVGNYLYAFAKQAAYEAEGGGGEGEGAEGEGDAGMAGMAAAGGEMPGGPMGGAPMGGGGGAGGEEEALAEFVAALDEMGITPEEFVAAIQAGEGGEMPGGGMPGGGMPGGGMPGGGMPPPDAAPAAPEAMKMASAAKAFKRSGRYQFKAADNGTPRRQLRNEFKSVINELISR
jgi:hypothetical protein